MVNAVREVYPTQVGMNRKVLLKIITINCLFHASGSESEFAARYMIY